MRKFYVLFIAVLLSSIGSFATTWYSQSTGDPGSLGNWNSVPGGGGAVPTSFVTPGDVWIMQNSMTSPSGSPWTLSPTSTLSLINPSTSWSITAMSGFTVGNLNITGNCSIVGSSTNTLNISGDLTISGTAWITTSSSNYVFMNNASATLASPQHLNITSATASTNTYIYVNAPTQLLGNTTWNGTWMYMNNILDCQNYTLGGSFGFTINSTATIITQNTGGLNGTFTNTGSRSINQNASFVFNGTAAQVTGALMPTTLFPNSKITINNPAGVTLSQSTTLQNTVGGLTFTNGVLSTGIYTLFVPGNAVAVSGAGANSFVKGTLVKTITGLTTINYEVGDTTYSPMSLALSAAGTAGSIGVKAVKAIHPQAGTSTLNTAAMVSRYWTITNVGAAGPAAVIPTATYNAADILGGSNASFFTNKYTGAAWLPAALVSTNTSAPYTTTPTSGISLASLAGDYIYGTPPATVFSPTSSMDFGSIGIGLYSSGQFFNLSGLSLTSSSSLTITAPANFQVSPDNTTWASSYSLPYTGTAISSTPVYVRFDPAAATAYTGTVTVTGGGLAATANLVTLTGIGSATTCSGAPSAGTASITPGSGGTLTPFTLSLTGATTGGGVTYQWQSSLSPTSGFTNIAAATTVNYSFTGISNSYYYRALVTCPTFGIATSNTVVATFSMSATYTGSIGTYTVPAGVTSLRIVAAGGQGGNITTTYPAAGGSGAIMQGDFCVTPGQVLAYLVGGQGAIVQYTGGGGGGSFVWDNATGLPLIAAGGGGGAGYNSTANVGVGMNASIGINGTLSGAGSAYGGAGIAGGGGVTPTAATQYGSGGAGWLSNGAGGNFGSSGCSYVSAGGLRPLASGLGGVAGGGGLTGYNGAGAYGGGGGGQGYCNAGSGGGGGGYSGGAGGPYTGSNLGYGGGGGGSLNTGVNQVNSVGNTGNGSVVFSIPTSPAGGTSLATLAFGPQLIGLSSAPQTTTFAGVVLTPGATINITTSAGFDVSIDGGATWVLTPAATTYTASSCVTLPIQVRFSPTTPTAYTGNLNVSGAGLPSTVSVALSGTGIVACAGVPTAGTATISAIGGGTSTVFNMNVTGSTLAAGIVFQWQSSPDSTTWSNISGATNTSFSTSGITATTYFRCNVTCSNSFISVATNVLTANFLPTVCTPSFSNSGCSNLMVAGSAANPFLLYGALGTSISDGSNCSGSSYIDQTGSGMTATLITGSSYTVRVGSNTQSSYPMSDQIWIDYNNNGVFESSESVGGGSWSTATLTHTITIPAGVQTGVCRMRVVANYASGCSSSYPCYPSLTPCPVTGINQYGDVRDYVVTIAPPPPCAAPASQPTGLTFSQPILTTINGSFTQSSPIADGYLVVMTTSSVAPTAPVNGIVYTAGTSALGGTIVSASAFSTFSATGVTPGTQYWFWVYAYTQYCAPGVPPIYKTTSPLSGTYTVPNCSISGVRVVGPTGDYPTIAAALNALGASGIAGPTAIELQTAYTGETYPIALNTYPCLSATNNITIRPQGTMTVTTSYAGPMFNFNGARYVTIDGRVGSTGSTKALTVANNSTAGYAVQFVNDASYNNIKYTTLLGSNTTYPGGVVTFGNSTGSTGSNYNTIDNCNIMDAPAGTPAVCISGLGTLGKENKYNTISNCNIANYYSGVPTTTNDYGIYIQTGSNWTITGNRFYQTATRAWTLGYNHGAVYISVSNTFGGFVVNNNIIGYQSSAGTGNYSFTTSSADGLKGIYLSVGYAPASSVQGNTITNISGTGTGSSAAIVWGIYIAGGSVNVGDVTPNIIGSATTNGAITVANATTSTAQTLYGIYSGSNSPAILNIQNNVIAGLTTTTGATNSSGICGINLAGNAATTVTGNTIGSALANSLNASTATSGGQQVYGINASISSGNPLISNNIIQNLNNNSTSTIGYTYGIINSNSSNPTISNNTIANISGMTLASGVASQPGVGGFGQTGSGTPTFTQNTIHTIANNNTSATQMRVVGIYFTSGLNGIIDRNKIYDIANASTGSSVINPPTADGVLIVSPVNSVTVTNNMISLGNSRTTNTSFNGILAVNNVAYTLKAYYNSVNIEGTVGGTATMHTAAFHRGNYASGAGFTNPTVDIRNNIFVNNRTNTTGTGVHYAIGNSIGGTSSATSWPANSSNYNILNAVNANAVGYWTTGKTFATWQTASASDANSYGNVAVTFSATPTGDLHIAMPGTTPTYIESHGTAISGLAYDYDNDARPGPVGSVNGGGTLPDIGADEYDGKPVPSMPPAITYSTPIPGCGTGTRVFTATIVDSAIVQNSGNFVPQVNFRKNSLPYWIHTPGTLTSGTTTNGVWTFTINPTAMLPDTLALNDTVKFFVSAQDLAGNIGSSPAEVMGANDTTVTTFNTAPNYYTITPSLAGTYTISTTPGADYATIGAAVNAYNTGCLGGPVTFLLADTSYPGETFPIVIARNNTASTYNTLTIKPAAATAVKITAVTTVNATAIFKLLNASHVTIDGLNTGGASLMLNNQNLSAANAGADIWLSSTPITGPGCLGITLKNMTMYGGSNTVSGNACWNIVACGDASGPSSGAGIDNDSVTIQGNTFLRACYGVFATGSAPASGPSPSSAGGLDGWNISNNTFGPAISSPTDNLATNACWLGSYQMYPTVSNNTFRNIGTNLASTTVAIGWGSFATGVTISKNNINGVVSGAAQAAGIYFQGNTTNSTITQNTITNISCVTTSSGVTNVECGILAGTGVGNGSTNVNITRNIISNIYNASTSTCSPAGRGIVVSNPSLTSNMLIANNMISDLYGYNCGSIGYAPAGIDIEVASGGIKIWDNTVNMNVAWPSASGTSYSTALLCNNTTGGTLDVRGNIFTNTYDNTSFTSDKNYAIYATVPASYFTAINNNAYYANNAAGSPIGYIGSTDRMTLADVQAGFGGDANSIVVLPQFVSSTDAHLVPVAQNLPLLGANASLAPTVTVDFDSTVRNSTTPVIGAQEISIPTCSSATTGTIAQSAPICASGITTLTAASATSGVGATYQWRTSADGVNYTNIAGATTNTYTLPSSISSTTYYRMVTTCSPASAKDSITKTVTINPAVAPITGGSFVCLGGTMSLSDATTGGSWSSSTPTVISVGTSGVVTGNIAGSATITYTAPTGCQAYNGVAVNTFVPTFTLAGAPSTVCSDFYSSTVTATGAALSGYSVTSVPYAPLAFTPSAVWSSTTAPTVGTNDQGYFTVAMPFAFNLYGTGYSVSAPMYISTNGFLSFTTTGLTTGSQSFSTFPTTSFSSVISAIGHDLNMPTGDLVGNIKWGLVGTAPTRKLVVSWNCYDATFASIPETAQLIMEETTNAVEVHVTNINSVQHTIGIENTGGTAATTVPGHQNSGVAVANAAWRFTPNAASYTWSPSSFLNATTGNSVVASNITTTPNITYTVNSSFNGCASSNTVTLTVNQSPAAITGTATACAGGTSALGEATTGGAWSSSAAGVASVGTDGTVTAGATVGTATISYVVGTCAATKVFTTTGTPGAISGILSICTGTTTTLANALGGVGTWSSPSANVSVTTGGIVTGVTAGTATVSYVNGCGTPVTAVVTVSQTPAAITGTGNVCPGATTTLANVNGGGSWSSLSANVTIGSSNGAITGVNTGTALITYDLGNGCAVATTVATVNLAPSVPTFTPAAPPTVCLGKGATISASISPSIPGVTYTWSGIAGATGLACTTCSVNTITPTVAGANTYSVVVATTLGCTASSIVTVNATALPPAITGAGAICAGGNLALSNTLGGGTWSSGNTGVAVVVSTTGSVAGMAAGTSVITYNAPTGCFATTIVSVQPTPVAAPINSSPICNGGTVTLTANPSGGASTYAWSGPGLSSTTVANPTAMPTTNSVYSLTVTNGTALSGCAPTTVYTTSVTVNSIPTAAPTNSGPICKGGTVTLTANPAGSTSAYSWSGSSLSSTTVADPTATLTATGTYVYTLVTTSNGGASGCSSTYTTSVTVNGLPTVASITPSVTSLCPGGAVTFTAGTTTGTGSVVGYNWTGPNGYTATTAANNVAFTPTTVASSGTYSVAVVYSANGCTSNPVATSPAVTVNALPTVASITPSSLTPCTGNAFTLTSGATTGTGALVSYNWSGPNSYSATTATLSAVLSPTTTAANGVYSLTVTYPNPGCISNAATTAAITFSNGPILANASNNSPVCVGGILTLTANSPSNVTSYAWSGPVTVTNSTTANGTVSPATLSGSGIYTVVVTNSSCSNTYTTSVTVNQVPSVAGGISSNAPLCANNTLLLSSGTASNVTGYAWAGPVAITNSATAAGSVPSITTGGTGTYSLTVNNGVGSNCAVTYTTAVTVPASSPVYSVTGGGVYCSGGSGVQVGLGNSTSGIQYQLYRGVTPVGGAVTGSGTALTFGFQTAAGTYTITGTNTSTGCVAQMASSAVVSISPPPSTFNVTGGGAYCAGGTGVAVNLSYSDVGASYQLYNGATPMGTPVVGNGAPITFGNQTAAGTYNVIANPGSACGLVMAGSVTVSINPLPTSYTLTGGGTYCAGGAGTPVGLTFGSGGIQYTLYNGATAFTVVNGANTALSFGNQVAAGTYTVSATNLTTGCVGSMAGSVNVTVNSAPTPYAVTGGGAYCSGGTGIPVGLSSSAAGVTYQLYNGSSAIGTGVVGTGSPLAFGNQSAAGVYTVLATGGNTCTTAMSGSATVSVNSAPIAYAVTGGGNYCSGGAGMAVGLGGSALGVNYQLYNGSTVVTTVSGTGSAISFGTYTAAGTYSVLGTNPTTGCATNMSGTAVININAVPAAFVMTGSGGYCPGGSGVAVGLGGSATGVSYQLYLGSSAIGTPMIGTGFGLAFGNQTSVGTYTVLATIPATGCTTAMTGSAIVNLNPLPTAFTVTGGGNYCSGGTGVAIGLTGSTGGVSYQLYLGAAPQGASVAGTGSSLNFGLKTAAGTYSVIATNTSTNCISTMASSAVVSVNALPAVYNVTGGGAYCTGGAGVAVGLSGSATGTSYQLYNGATAVGGPVNGTGSSISFGNQPTAATYTVVATNGVGCTANMTGSATVTTNTPPTAYAMTGGATICSSSTGTPIGLSNSTVGVSYQLYNGAATVGSPVVSGAAGAISFGNQTAAGTYTVLATTPATGCTTPMTGTAVISVNPSPAAFAVTGGGSYCSGGSGVAIGMNNSAVGVNYQLMYGITPQGSAIPGTGAAFNFPTLATTAGAYTVTATAGTCTTAQTGNAVVSINVLPTIYPVTGGGTICAGTGSVIGLASSQIGVSYQLYNGSTPSGAPVAGSTGSAISFAPSTAAGTYTVSATSAAGCAAGMGGATIISLNPAPTAFAVTGGGSYCSGTGGLTIGLAGSNSGIIYTLYNGSAPVTTLSGTGTSFTFPAQTAAGTYSVQASDGTTSCTSSMSGTATISIIPLPTAFSVTGGGGYCAGGTGVSVGLSGSSIGTNYQLYAGGAPVGSVLGGSGLPIGFGAQTAAGTYSVVAINPSTGCINTMTSAATVTVNALPAAFTVTGGGGYCSGTVGVAVGLAGSQSGVTYKLYNGTAIAAGPVAGTNAPVNFGLQATPGTYSVLATTTATGCTNAMYGMPTVSVNPLPTAFVVTGGGNICAGGAGVNVGLNSSAIGVSYQLNAGGYPAGAPVMGTGGPISFGPQTTAGAYNVMATDVNTNCTNYMSGAVNVNVNAAPTAYSVTGGGTMCAGGAGASVYLASSDAGVYYQLYNGATAVGMSLVGSGSSLNFGLQAAAGNYTVLATDPATGCSGAMSGVASNIVTPLPMAFAVTGGGSYCSGTAGVAVGLANSTSGVNYQLYNGTTTIGSPIAGTGSAISFGTQTMTGTYTVVANNLSTGCSGNMAGSATVTITPSPAAFAVTGGGHYCAGGAGVTVGLAASGSGVTYQLYNNSTLVSTVAGTGGVISFGSQTGAGTYTVLATTSGCSGVMAGSATVVMDTLPAAQTVTGSGTYCSGSGAVIGLGGSEAGVTYQLYNGTLTAGSPVLGTGAPISSGPLTTAGTYSVIATNALGCSRIMPGVATIIVTPAPTAYAVTGGGGYCTGGTGVSIVLGGSESNVNYQLYRGSTAVGSAVAGTGAALNFGAQTAAGVYTVQASSTTSGCTGSMSGSATVTVNAVPTAYNVLSTGSSYCAGTGGVNVLLSGSQSGVSYQLFNGSTPTGAPVTGSGGLLDFGPQTAAGTYIVVATGSGSCSNSMSGSASISITSLPALYTITGGGGYCSGTSGAPVGLSSSDTGVSYQLFRGTTTVGTPVTGTGSAISFGPQATVGSYVIVATNTASGCQHTMSGSVSVSMNPQPGAQTVTGGGTICSGATASIILTGSASGISYQLYNGSSLVGSAIPGTGSAISFGPQTAAGVYTVLAVNSATLCGRSMTGSATIVVNPAPTAYAVTGGGNYCVGSGTGVAVGLANTAAGFTYQLYNGTTPVSGALAGTSSALDFGVQSTPGTYTIKATDATTLCASTMTGAAVINASPAPAMHFVTGGGSYCGGGTGVHVGLDGSNSGISYRLYNGATAVASAMLGTGTTIDFGAITGTGSYTVLATNTTSGCTAAMPGSADVLSVTVATPSVSISTSGGDTMCLGILTTFNAVGVNGGTGATYQWQVNGSNVGLGGSTYTYLPANGDVISVQMISSLACATPAAATSSLPVTVLVSQMPVAQLNVTPNDTVCMGTAVTFSVTPVYGGSAPTYTWKNGAGSILSIGSSYTFTPSNGDMVYVQMSSNYRCRLADNVESIHSTMVIDSPTAPVVIVHAPSGFREGQSATLAASVSNGGRNPEFQWYVNNAPITGATSSTFTSSALTYGDSVSCLVTKISSCAPVAAHGSVIMRNTTGVSGATVTNSDIRLLPNPNTGDFVIRGTLGTADDQDFVAEVTDMLGQVIYKDNVSARNGNVNQHISLSNTLANGMYMLTLRSATESKVFHFVIGK